MVLVKYSGSIVSYAGTSQEEVKLEVALRLEEFLKLLARLKGQKFRERLFHCGGELEADILVFVNNVDHRLVNGMDTKVTDGDEVLIISYVHPG